MSAVKNLLEGKPLRTPLHAALVHLPIALFPMSVLLDVASRIMAAPEGLTRAAFACLVAGLIAGLVAGLVGMVDYTEIRVDHPAKRIATRHMVLNLGALGVFGASAALRYSQLAADRTPIAPLLLSLVGLGLLGYSGYLGGDIVYADGIGVGRHRRREHLPKRTTVTSVGAGEAEVAVAEEAALPEGHTLRVDVGGVVVAIARVQGEVYAFQEFCTHRYGPLSEGAIRGCEIVCPWHNSRFDVRNGKVTQGPAKVDLRTFRVQRRDGKIWLQMNGG